MSLESAVDSLWIENIIVVMTGDSVAPSKLSSLDKGYGMVDVINRLALIMFALTIMNLSDIPHADLLKRIEESKFVWINSNMPNLPGTLDTLPSYAIVSPNSNSSSST